MKPLCVLQKERRLLENLRLDLDACKTRLKKAKVAEAKAAVSTSYPKAPYSLPQSFLYYKTFGRIVFTLTLSNSLRIDDLCSAMVK